MFTTGYRNGNSLIAIHEHTEQTKKARGAECVDKVFTLVSVPHTHDASVSNIAMKSYVW